MKSSIVQWETGTRRTLRALAGVSTVSSGMQVDGGGRAMFAVSLPA